MRTEVPGGKMARRLELTSKILQRNKQGAMKQTLQILVSVDCGGDVGPTYIVLHMCI